MIVLFIIGWPPIFFTRNDRIMKPVFHRLAYAVGAIISFALFYFLLTGLIKPAGQVLADGWVLTENGHQTEIELPFRESISKLSILKFSRKIQYESGQGLVLARLDGQALEVRLDGDVIFSVGDLAQPTANIWNQTFLIALPDDDETVMEKNLDIYLSSASYPIDIANPPYIMDMKSARRRVALANLVYNDFLLIAIGASLLIGFILIFLSMMQKRRWSVEMWMGWAAVLAAVESYDFAYSVSLGSLAFYFAFKKILISAGYLASFAFLASMEKYCRQKLVISKSIAIPTLLSVLLIVFLKDMTKFNDLIAALNLILLLNVLISIYYLVNRSRVRNWMIFLAVWLSLSILQVLANLFFGFTGPYVMQTIVLLSTAIFGVNLLLDFNRIYAEKQDLEKRIVMDTLTTAYNRNILGKAASEQYDVLILMDLDNFKAYNDKHGHQQGDLILIKFTEIIKKNLRHEDLVVRYGGDEFLVLLSGINIPAAEQVALRIRRDLEEATRSDNLSVSYGIEKLEHSLDSDLDKADRLMYAMKQAKQIQLKNNSKKQDKP